MITTEYGTRLDDRPVSRSATVDGVPDFVNLYEYDDQDRWIARSHDPDGDGPLGFTDTFFVYDGTPPSGSLLDRSAVTMENIGQIVLHFESDAQGDPQLAHRYLWGPAVDQILADEQITDPTAPGNVVWPLTDHLNTDTTTIIRRASLGSGIVFGVRRVIGLAYSLFSRRNETSGGWYSCSSFQQIQGGQQMGGQDETILEQRNSQLTGAVAVFNFLLGKHNLLASPNLLEVMCLKKALGERSTDRPGDGRNAQPSLFPPT